MAHRTKYSKALHWLVVLFLLTPFYYTGCDENNKAEVPTQDTTMVNGAGETLITQDTISYEEAVETQKSVSVVPDSSEKDKGGNSRSMLLSHHYPALRPVLVSKDCTYSGLAICIDSMEYVPYFSTFLFALFLVLALVIKYIDRRYSKVVVLLHLLAVIFLVIARPLCWWDYSKLWGYWITLGLMGVLALYDGYVCYEMYRKRTPEEPGVS